MKRDWKLLKQKFRIVFAVLMMQLGQALGTRNDAKGKQSEVVMKLECFLFKRDSFFLKLSMALIELCFSTGFLTLHSFVARTAFCFCSLDIFLCLLAAGMISK